MSQEKKPGLFDGFPPISTQQWEELIYKDLKGADYNKKLVWQTPDGLHIKPYYRAEDLADLEYLKTLPNEYPFVRGKNIKENHWEIRQDIDEMDPLKANALALDYLQRGADSIGLNMGSIDKPEQLASMLKGISLADHAVHFLHSKNYKPLFRDITALIHSMGWDKAAVKGSLNFDPLGFYLLYSKFYGSAEENFRDALEIIHSGRDFPQFRLITVNGQHFHNAGASIVQELAFALSQGNEYLAQLTQEGISADQAASRMQFTMAVGSDFFPEIAKLRAIKMLWAKVVEQYNPQNTASMKINLHAVTSAWNKTIYDPYVNMLRSTTEAMAAAIAGVDSMTVEPFDATYKKGDEFSSRIARNQQIILKHEAYFNRVVDPGAGSYYIENITDAIAEAAWKLFVETEEAGGFIKAVENGTIQTEIRKTSGKRDMDIAMRKQVFVGVNQYPNTSERMLGKLQPNAKLSDLAGLKPYRGVQAFEALRLAVENHENKGFATPGVYLFTWGNLAMRKARATFSSNFFGCAGYVISEGTAESSLEAATKKAIASGSQIIVLCSSDEEYADMIPAITAIREKQPHVRIVVAGNPTELIPQLNQAGVQHYIHMRTNTLETLQHFNDLLGIS